MSHRELIGVSPSHTFITQVTKSQSVQQVTTSHIQMQVIMTHQMSSHIAWVTIWITTKRGYHQCTPTFHLWLGYYLHMCSLPMEVGRYDVRPVSLDQHKGLFHRTIIDRNKHWWFFLKSKKGIHKQVNLPVVQLLKDMKTWWDSVYLMLECLIMLQPVSYLFHFHS